MKENRSAVEVVKNKNTTYYETDESLDFFNAGRMLRHDLRHEVGGLTNILTQIYHAKEISKQRFEELARERMSNEGHVPGAFVLDYDAKEMHALNCMDGWQAYRMRDISAAVYFADLDEKLPDEERWPVFLSWLEGKQLTPAAPVCLCGTRHLTSDDITFADEILENDGQLNFYMEVDFDPDEIFGTNVSTDENDDYLNVYANYDLVHDRVCNELIVILSQQDGDTEYRYGLSRDEQQMVGRKMDAYCQTCLGMSLAECRERFEEELLPAPEQCMNM